MVPAHLLIAFVAASTALFLTPGPGMTLVLATSAAHGTRAGLLATVGNAMGLALLLALVLAGLQTIASNFEAWFPWVRGVGAAYLVWLGIKHLINANRPRVADAEPASQGAAVARSHLMNGFGVAISNPAVIAFLGAFLPQFIDPARPTAPQFVTLAALFIAIQLTLSSTMAVVADRASRALLGANGILIDRVAGGVLILGGLLLAWR